MSQTVNLDRVEIAQASLAREGVAPGPAIGSLEETKAKEAYLNPGAPSAVEKLASSASGEDDEYERPTEEELHTLRRVSGKIYWPAYTIAFCELAERFSYYGSTILYANFVRSPLPEGSTTGANRATNGVAGAMGMGSKAAQGIVLFNQFFAYLMPLFGAYIADARLGRYKTIHIAIAASFIAHLILVASAAPAVIVHQKSSFAAFIIGLLCLCVGTGLFKANISPLLAEQNHERGGLHIRTTEKGERVIVDPAVTNTRIFLYFYFAINVGSCAGQISMVYVEKFIGFWLAWLLPTVLFVACPVVLYFNKKRYTLSPPTGSVLSKFVHMFGWVMRGKWTLNFARIKREFTWDVARPSNIAPQDRPAWMTYDDEWVDEVRRGLKACKVFLFLPIFFLAYNQMTGNLTTQASTMELHGVPNDVIQNLNPLSILILIPILDRGVYPALRKVGINFTPIKRMTLGFFFSALSMVAAAVTQHYIYKMSPCGNRPTDKEGCTAPINVWVQSLPYILVGISEIFTNTTSYEYAYSKAPENMKSMVMSINLFMSAISSAIGQAFTPLSGDPLLVWNYTAVSCIAVVGGSLFWYCFSTLDRDEDHWNTLARSKYKGKNQPLAHDIEDPVVPGGKE